MHLTFSDKFRCLVNSLLSSWNGGSCPIISGPRTVCTALSSHQHLLHVLRHPCTAWAPPPSSAPSGLSVLWLDLSALCSCKELDCFASAAEREPECCRRLAGIGMKWHTNLKLTMTVFVQSHKKPTQIIWELKMNVSEHFHSHRTILASCWLHILQKHLLLAQGNATTECSAHYWHYSPAVLGALFQERDASQNSFQSNPGLPAT